jgi:predicted RNA-binding protein YlxR (DUF448 family)
MKSSRTCVGCHGRINDAPQGGGIRFVLVPAEGGGAAVAVDLAGGSFGRGAHVHATGACLLKACSGGFAKAFRRPISVQAEALLGELERAASRRIEGLLLGARRGGLLAFGDDAKERFEDPTNAPLLVVARDAGSEARFLERAVASGRALAWGTKDSLGRLFSREAVAKVAVCSEGVAKEISRAIRIAGLGTDELVRTAGTGAARAEASA